MDINMFMEDLINSYPEGIRPDIPYTAIIKKELSKRPCTSRIYEQALANIQGSFRMFPTLMDIKWAFNEAFKSASTGAKQGVEYYDIGKHTFVRPVKIGSNGDLLRDPLPEGATNYQLVLPPEMQCRTEAITADEAYAEGCISEDLYRAIKSKKENQPYKGRFQKIGEMLKKEEQPQLPIIEAEYEVIDDSMAANPEEPAHYDFEDI